MGIEVMIANSMTAAEPIHARFAGIRTGGAA